MGGLQYLDSAVKLNVKWENDEAAPGALDAFARVVARALYPELYIPANACSQEQSAEDSTTMPEEAEERQRTLERIHQLQAELERLITQVTFVNCGHIYAIMCRLE